MKRRENLHGDAKGKGTSVADRKAESTDALVSGGLLGSSDEASVMLVERRVLPLRRSACRDADFAHFHYASGITILRRRNCQIFGPNRQLAKVADGLCPYFDARLHFDTHLSGQTA